MTDLVGVAVSLDSAVYAEVWCSTAYWCDSNFWCGGIAQIGDLSGLACSITPNSGIGVTLTNLSGSSTNLTDLING